MIGSPNNIQIISNFTIFPLGTFEKNGIVGYFLGCISSGFLCKFVSTSIIENIPKGRLPLPDLIGKRVFVDSSAINSSIILPSHVD